ncbi:Uncharacterised protein r2_g4337 [Pycnogonum litorale]
MVKGKRFPQEVPLEIRKKVRLKANHAQDQDHRHIRVKDPTPDPEADHILDHTDDIVSITTVDHDLSHQIIEGKICLILIYSHALFVIIMKKKKSIMRVIWKLVKMIYR